MLDIDEFQKIFEFEIRTKLSRRCQTKNEEIRQLYNSFRFYDYGSSSIIDKNGWIKGIQKSGLCGFNLSDLSDLFARYDKNNTGYINYKNFTYYIYGKEELLPLSKEYMDDALSKLLEQNNDKNEYPSLEFKPPGLYDRSYEIMLDNEKRFNKLNNNINRMKKNVEEEKVGNYMERNNRTPYIKRYNNNLSNLSIQNYSLFFQNEPKYKKFLQKFKSKVNINNGITYYTFMKELNYYQNQNDKTINVNTCFFLLKKLGIDFKFYDLIELFKCIDKINSDKIKTEELLKLTRGEINIKRKILIQNVFNYNDKEQKGKIKLKEIKNLYNAKMHPDVYVGYKTEKDIYKEFLYTFDTFCEFYEIYDYINCEEFIEYYKGISASIVEDNYFDDILNGVWNINIKKEKDDNFIVNEDININDYSDVYKNRLTGNEINTKNNYLLNNRYVNNKIKNNFTCNNIPKEEEEKQNLNASSLTPIPKFNEKNFEKITPYYPPIKTPFLNRNNKMIKRIQHNPITNEIKINRENSKQNYYGTKCLYKQNIMNILEKMKELIMSRGQKGIFNLQKLFCLYDKEKTGQITYIKFIELCEIFNINLERKNLKKIFDYFDKEKIGIINYDELIQELIKNISIDRVMAIKEVYNNFEKDKFGYVSINDIRKRFKPFNHPNAKSGIQTEQEVYFELLECLNIYKIYRSNVLKKYNIDILNYEGFLDFFKEISFSTKDDMLFKEMLYRCFCIN